MKKDSNSSVWAEEGYTLFAKEGIEGVQIERLARILKLNKSGFYHYFGDLNGFCEQLLILHEKKAECYLADAREVTTIDPGYLQLIIDYKIPIMFQIQLIRNKNIQAFKRVAETIDQKEDVVLQDLWTDYIGFHDNPDLAIRYFNIVRDMLYTRLNLQNINYPFLHSMMNEARELMQQIIRKSVAPEGAIQRATN